MCWLTKSKDNSNETFYPISSTNLNLELFVLLRTNPVSNVIQNKPQKQRQPSPSLKVAGLLLRISYCLTWSKGSQVKISSKPPPCYCSHIISLPSLSHYRSVITVCKQTRAAAEHWAASSRLSSFDPSLRIHQGLEAGRAWDCCEETLTVAGADTQLTPALSSLDSPSPIRSSEGGWWYGFWRIFALPHRVILRKYCWFQIKIREDLIEGLSIIFATRFRTYFLDKMTRINARVTLQEFHEF